MHENEYRWFPVKSSTDSDDTAEVSGWWLARRQTIREMGGLVGWRLESWWMRILVATIGSLGDLYPCLALAKELKGRGHSVAIATTEVYRSRVLGLGLGFYSLRPDWDPADSELIGQCDDLKRGPEILIRNLVLPHLEDAYEDLLAAARDVDLMLACELVYAAPLVAEKLRLQWASVILSPCSFFSAHDPSLLVNMPSLIRIRRAGWRINRAVLEIGIYLTRHWWEPVRKLRKREGLKEDCAPLTRDKFSKELVLALFSDALAESQPDWPPRTVQTGFVFHEEARREPGVEELEEFLAAGEAPIVFTLGSTVVASPGNFYEASAEAAERLGRRALLIGARDFKSRSAKVLAVRYAPYGEIFKRASVIVHQGGSGTTAQALRAGKPMLIVPFGWDQPDNGLRVKRQGAGLVVARAKYSADTSAAALKRLLEDSSFADRAGELGLRVGAQDGVIEACDAIERLLMGVGH